MPVQFTPNLARVERNVGYIALTDRKGIVVGEAIVDLADLFFVLTLGRWHIRYAKDTCYVAMHGEDGKVLLHRLLLDAPDDLLVDHRNHNGLDCRRKNLRLCTSAQNGQNRRGPGRRTSSGVRGVYWQSNRGCWGASLCVEGKRHFLGSFATVQEAAEVVRTARGALMPFAAD